MSKILLAIGILFLLSPFFLSWFIHGSYERYIWLINGPYPFSSFGSGPFQLMLHVILIVLGLLSIIASLVIKGDYMPTSKKPTHLISPFIGLGALVVIILGLALLLYSTRLVGSISKTTQPSSKFSSAEQRSTLLALQNDLSVTAPMTDWRGEWRSEDKTTIPIKGPEFSIGTSKNNTMGQYGHYKLEDVTVSVLKEIQTKTDKFFTRQGFNKSEPNSYKEDTNYVLLQSGYEKGGLKCLATLYVQTDPFGHFLCGTIDREQEKLWRELSKLYDYSKVSIWVEKRIGDFAYVSVGDRSGGGYFSIIAKQNGEWKEVFAGQDYGPCKLMDDNKVPKEIYDNCVNDNGKIRFLESPGI